jgi:hypothetical protein
MIPANLTPLANHLWQSTLFAAAAGLLSLALRKQRAQVRYGLWLAASVKFLVPFALLAWAVNLGGGRPPPSLNRRFRSRWKLSTSPSRRRQQRPSWLSLRRQARYQQFCLRFGFAALRRSFFRGSSAAPSKSPT